MGQSYVGEIRMFAGNFPPAGWMTCDGQLLPITENETLFNLIGTTYGGDGVSTFALPNLTARVPIHQGSNGTSTYTLAQNGGVTSVPLPVNQIPVHTHPVIGDSNQATTTTGVPTNGAYGNTAPAAVYGPGSVARNVKTMMTLPAQGGSQPHDNMQPYLAVTYIISLFGNLPESDPMSDPFVAEIRIFPFNFAPKGWAFCNGQLMPIPQNTALFSLLGTNYGGDGKSTFGLPNLQGSVPIHTTQYAGTSPFGTFDIGEFGGEDYVTLLTSAMPAHSHDVKADDSATETTLTSPSNAYPGNPTNAHLTPYSNSATPQSVSMNPSMISVAGSSSPHNNLMPYLTLNYCIALQGVYPPRS